MSNPLSNLTFHSPTLYEIDNSDFINLLERTIINNNEQNRLAQQAATELSNTITAMNVHHSMAGVKNKLYNDLNTLVDNTLQNYGGNLKYATNEIIRQSGEVVRKMQPFVKSNEDYEKWVASIKSNPDIDADTKEFILNDEKNKYHFDAKVINDNGEEEYIDNWQVGDNDNIIGYKPWQAGREPVTQRNYLEFAVNVLKTLDADNNQYTVRKFYDANGNELKDEAILNAAYYVDNGSTKVILTEQKINDAIENAINSDLSIQASLRQDYDKAKYFRDKGDDRYGIGVGTNSVLSPEGYKNKIFSGFAPTYAIKNTVWSTIPSIITTKDDKDGGGDGGGDSNKVTRVANWSASVGIIEREYNPSQVAEQYRTDIKAINDDFSKVIAKYNIPINIQAIDQLSTNEQINIIKNNKDKITNDDVYVGMVNALQRKLDYQERLTLYDQDIFNKLPPEQQALIKKYEALNNGNYLNFEEDSPFITYYNNFFKTSNGDVLNEQFINFNDKEISNAILTLANKKGINLGNCGIHYDVATDEFGIINDPLAFKVLSELTYNGLNTAKGVAGKYLYEIMEYYRDPNNLGAYPSLSTNDENYTPQLVKLGNLIGFGSAYTKVAQEQQDVKKEAGLEVNKEHLDTHHLYDIGYTLLKRDNATNEQLNEYKVNLRDEITKLDYTQYEVYVSDNMEIDKEYVYNFSDKGRENRKREDERDGSLRLLTDSEKLKKLQNVVELALNNKTVDNNKSVNIDYAPNSYNNIQIGFSDVANIGVGNYIKVPYGNEVYTVFIKTNKGVNGTEGGLNDYQRAYIQSPEYIYKREIDELSLGDNPIPRTLNIGTTNTYKMGYIKTNDGYGNYYVKQGNNIVNLSKEEMIGLIGIREGFKDLAKQVRFLPDDVERELKRAAMSESFDGNMTLLQPYNKLINDIGVFAATYAKTLSILSNSNETTVTRNIINDILNYY